MTGWFEYEEQSACVCGTPLSLTSAVVQKALPRGTVTFRRCVACHTWCQSPIVTGKSMQDWVDSDEYQGSNRKVGLAYSNYLADEDHRLIESRGRYQHDLRHLIPPKSRVLEIGCATGSLLSVLRDHGCEVLGIDLSRRFSEFARERHGLTVLLGDVLNMQLPPEKFDAVMLFGTISNVGKLGQVLETIRGMLKPGGQLIFNFPDAGAFLVRYAYGRRFWMFTPSVANFMTLRGCETALVRAGFKVQTVSADVQRPSLRKLLKHAGLESLTPVAKWLGISDTILPVALPIPAIRFVVAIPA